MIIMWPLLNTGDNYLRYHTVFILFMAFTTALHSAANLKDFIVGDVEKAAGSIVEKKRLTPSKIVGLMCDYGLLLFVLFLAVLFREYLIFIIGVFTAIYAVALLGVLMKNRKVV